MSLDVSPDLLASAEEGEVDEAAFVDCVRTSLPYAWETISLLVAEHVAGAADRPFVDNQVPPPDEQARGQLLRALASDAIRGRWNVISGSRSPSRTATGWRSSPLTRPARGVPAVRVPPGPTAQPVTGPAGLLRPSSRRRRGER